MMGWLFRMYLNRADPALKLQRPIQKFTGYDRVLQEQAIRDAQAKHREQFADALPKVIEKPVKLTEVVPFRKDKGA